MLYQFIPFALLHSTPLCGYTKAYPFYSSQTFGLFSSLVCYNESAINILIYVLVGINTQFCWLLSKNGILDHRTYVGSTLIHTTKHFPGVVGPIHMTMIHKVSVFHILAYMVLSISLILVIPVWQWYLIVVLIFIALITNDEHFFIGYFDILFLKCLFKSGSSIGLSFTYIAVGILYIFQI